MIDSSRTTTKWTLTFSQQQDIWSNYCSLMGGGRKDNDRHVTDTLLFSH